MPLYHRLLVTINHRARSCDIEFFNLADRRERHEAENDQTK
jgi:hypothetical protein